MTIYRMLIGKNGTYGLMFGIALFCATHSYFWERTWNNGFRVFSSLDGKGKG